MYKRGSGRYALFGIVCIILVVGVIAETSDIGSTVSELSNETQAFIKDLVSKENTNINPSDINKIEEVNLANPPDEVKLGNIDEDTTVAIYQVNYTQNDENKKLFVVTYATPDFKAPLELRSVNAIEYLNFGQSEAVSESLYLESATGVRGSDEKGYVMMDSGSITGISTNAELVNAGVIYVSVYKNGENTGLVNSLIGQGIQKDYDTQSSGVVTFAPGDIISVYVEVQGETEYKDVTNLVKIEIDDK